jgi:predicted enzyme related to lactoylglutathione lyase
MTTTLKNAVVWFEIPVRELDRSVTFYEAILGRSLTRSTFGGDEHAMFAADKDAVTGSLVARSSIVQMKPSDAGTVIYLDASELGLGKAVELAATTGGSIVLGPTPIGPHGTIAIVSDPDGDQIGLHVPPKA